jgi:hypothetical protein
MSTSNTLRTRPSASSLSPLDGQPRLKEWAEPGPSTPPKHSISQTENWDDDFEDKTDSPARQRPHHKRPKLPEIPEPENWDDDIDPGKFVSPKKDPTWDSSDEEDGPDFADQEEDKTVTAHPRKVALSRPSLPPPLPPLPFSPAPPGEAFPGSPTMSVFSVPSGRDSATYSSAAHLPLRGGSSSPLIMLPPSPPAQNGRRRLRKKSRPPDNNVFELLDRAHDSVPLPSPPQPTTPNSASAELPPSESNPRSSILSRIGSVKRWGARKRLTSPGPSDALDAGEQPGRDATPRAAASQSQTPSSRTPSWFFRSSETPESTPGSPLGSTTLELKHERSFKHLKAFAPVDSPTKTKKGRILGAMLGERSHDPGSASTEGSPPSSPRRPRRPKSMQVPTRAPPYFPRQASYGARSVSRSTSHTSTEDLSRESEGKGKEKQKVREQGHRGFMSGVRRISLVSGKKHKRTKSSGSTTIVDADEPPTPAVLQILPPSTLTVTSSIAAQLLPPIELQPPSPPREHESRRSIASERSIISTSESLAAGLESLLLQPAVDAKSLHSPPSITPKPSPTKGPGSPQSASLGRATLPPPTSTATGIVPRRNSLGDLKIPARISQAQVGLKRDLGMVREFAAEVESEYRNVWGAAWDEQNYRAQGASMCLSNSHSRSTRRSSRAPAK